MSHDIPSAFDELMDLADRVGGEVVVFDNDDHVVYASGDIRVRFPFFSFSRDDTYKGLYSSLVQNGLINEKYLHVSTQEYLDMILTARVAHRTLDFKRSYPGAELVCHHYGLPDGWSAQVRLDVAPLRYAGGIVSGIPDTVSAALSVARETAALRATINQLPIGVAVTEAGGVVVWANHAARASRVVRVQAGRPVTADGLDLVDAADAAIIRGVSRYMLAAVGGDVLSVTPGTLPGTALILISPPDASAAARECLECLGLAPSLSRAAVAVVTSGGADEAAASTGLALATIKRQLSMAYNALGVVRVTNQRALTQLVSRIAAIAAIPVAMPHVTGASPILYGENYGN